MAAHALEGWSFQFDHATRRAGCCHYDTRVISLAQAYARSATEADITDTILHEIAHVLVGQAHGHDAVWQAQARALGCSGRRCQTGSSLHRATSSCVCRAAGSAQLSAASAGRSVARVRARCAIRPTPKPAGSTPVPVCQMTRSQRTRCRSGLPWASARADNCLGRSPSSSTV